MPTYNYKSRELIAKIVYYGPGRCGKTTNLQQIHARMRPETRSELLSVATETDRTIYFDLLPLNLGTISGMKFMVRLFTVPGQVYYAETRKLVLRGADGIVFVADSQDHMMDENRQSLRDLKDNLAANGIDYSTVPLVLQYNKRDLPRLIPEAELDAALNDRGVKALSAVASEGTGVLETLRFVTLSVFNHIKAGGKDRPPGGPSVSVPGGLSSPAGLGAPPPPAPGGPMGGAPFGANAGGAGHGGMSLGGAAGGMSLGGHPGQGGMPLGAAGGGGMSLGAPTGGGMPLGAPVAGMPLPMPGAPPNATPAMGMPRPPNPAVNRGASGTGDVNRGPASAPGNGPAPPGRPPNPAATRPVSGGPSAAPPPPPAGGGPALGRPPPPPPGPRAAPPPPPGNAVPLNPNGPQPVKIGADLVLDEFKNLAIMHSQMAERLSAIEQELNRLGRENQEIREMLARQNQP